MNDDEPAVTLFCIRCDKDCSRDPYHLTLNDGSRDGPACAACARLMNGAAR